MAFVSHYKSRRHNVAGQQSRRVPSDEQEAWLAGLIVTDGTIIKKWGYTKITQKESAAETLEPIAARYGRRLRYEVQHGNFGINRKVHLQVPFLPVCWKTSVPNFAPLSDLERHYWRGVIDGDGSLSHIIDRGRLRLEVYLAWNPQREGFLGPAFARFLDRLDVPYKINDGQLAQSILKVRVRSHNDAVRLARYLYEDAAIALPWKRERALQDYDTVVGAAGRRTTCPAGHPYDEPNTLVTPKGHRKCRACGRERYAKRREGVLA